MTLMKTLTPNLTKTLTKTFGACAVLGLTGLPAHAVTDASADFLASYTGSTASAFDILQGGVSVDSDARLLWVEATTGGDIAAQPTLGFSFGLFTGGSANAPFGAIGVPDVRFNAVASLSSAGTGVLIVPGVSTTPIGQVQVDGDRIRASIAWSDLPSNGLNPEQFTWALWTVDSAVSASPAVLARNADFAPLQNVQVSAVPEPGSWALLAAGVGSLLLRRRRVAD